MDKQTHRIMTLLEDKRTDILERLERAGERSDRLNDAAVSYDNLLDRQGHRQDFEERRLDRLNDLAGRAEDLAYKLERRAELLRQALSLVEEEADVFGRVKPVSLAEMLK